MAWYLWVDDNKVAANCSDLSALSEKSAGFQGGKAAVAKNVNVALRQANLVACALMDVVDPEGTLSYLSTREAIRTKYTTYFSKFATTSGITDGTITASVAKQLGSNLGNIKIDASSDDEYILPNTVDNLPKFMLGSAKRKFKEMWSESFHGDLDGTATRATYASADTTKGTIEERLTNLGFKQLPSNRQFVPTVSGASLPGTLFIQRSNTTREGNRTNLLLSLSLSTSSYPYGQPMFKFLTGTEATCPAGSIPVEYRPATISSNRFGFFVIYTYTNGISVRVYIAIGCTVKTDGSIVLEAFSPTISGVSTALSSVTVESIGNPAVLDMGYQSNPL